MRDASRVLAINKAIDAQLLQVLEPLLVGRLLTRKEVDGYLRVAEGFLWRSETIKVEKTDGFGERQWKVTISRSLWQDAYPLDDNASVIYYEASSQLRILMSPDTFIRYATKFEYRNIESFMASFLFFRPSMVSSLKRIKAKEPLDPLFMDVNWKEPHPSIAHIAEPGWEVVSHEGRHRAVAAHQAGIHQVPVIFFVRVGGDLEALWNLKEAQILALHEFADTLRA